MGKRRIKNICFSAMLCAVCCICSMLAVPLPFGIPITLQTFAVALLAFCLPLCYAIFSYLAYLLLGALGLPVFSAFSGGLGVLFGPTGGFLWGFLILILFCGGYKDKKGGFLAFLSGILLLYIVGSVYFSFLGGVTLLSAFIINLPFLPKDILLVMAAAAVYKRIRPIMA